MCKEVLIVNGPRPLVINCIAMLSRGTPEVAVQGENEGQWGTMQLFMFATDRPLSGWCSFQRLPQCSGELRTSLLING